MAKKVGLQKRPMNVLNPPTTPSDPVSPVLPSPPGSDTVSPPSPGNIFSLPAPTDTFQETGIIKYVGQAIPGTKSITIIGYGNLGNELGRATSQVISSNKNETALGLVISQGNVILNGRIVIKYTSPNAKEVQITCQINGKTVEIRGYPESSANIQKSGELGLDSAELSVINQWSRLSDTLIPLARETMTTFVKSGPELGFWGCLALGAAIALLIAAFVAGLSDSITFNKIVIMIGVFLIECV
ncbi:MAG: hypothetical protein ACKVT2_18895 [Saprospiraceae bacterium]